MIWQRAIQIASATDIPEQQFELNFNMKKKPGPTAGFFFMAQEVFSALPRAVFQRGQRACSPADYPVTYANERLSSLFLSF